MSGYEQRNPEPFPVHKLTRVDRPTTVIHDDQVKRVSELDAGFMKARRGIYGPGLEGEVLRFVNKHPMSGAERWMMNRTKGFVDGMAAKQQAPIPDDPALLSRHIKNAAYFLRADLVGICSLPPYAVYTHSFDWKGNVEEGMPVNLAHKNAIAILIDQDWPTAEAFTGSDWISNAMSMLAYSTSGFIAMVLAEYIRRLGYPARAHFAVNYQVVLPPILLWAGLGEMSRIGDCVINPFLGPRFKAAVVTTDLPLLPDKPIDFGLQDFCSKCKKCARLCPSGALSEGVKVMHNGYEKWPANVEALHENEGWQSQRLRLRYLCESLSMEQALHAAAPRHRLGYTKIGPCQEGCDQGDDLFGYGRPDYSKKWWFDLEDVHGDGILTAPAERERKK